MKNNKILIIVLLVVLALFMFGRFGYGMMDIGGMMGGYYGFGWIFMIVAILCLIWVIYDVLVNNRGLSDGMKILWVICAVLFSVITAIIYYLFGRNKNNDFFRGR